MTSRIPPKPPNDDDQDEKPARSYLQLLPRRSLMRALLLVGLLIVIISFQRRGGELARRISEALLPPVPTKHDGGTVVHLKPAPGAPVGDAGDGPVEH